MSGVIDTNLLLYGVNQDATEHSAARRFLERIGQAADPWYLTDGILYEFLRVSTHPRVFPSPLTSAEALEFVSPLIRAGNVHVLDPTDDHWLVLEEVLRSLSHPNGNLFFDIRTVVLMREHGVRRIFTTDTDFLQFESIAVVNPLKG